MIEKGADLNPSTTLGIPLVSPEFGAGTPRHAVVSLTCFDGLF